MPAENGEQLRQAQKEEAVNRLAGGVTHDLNNILAGIILQAQLLAEVENTPKEIIEGLLEIHAAAERAAGLVRRLQQETPWLKAKQGSPDQLLAAVRHCLGRK